MLEYTIYTDGSCHGNPGAGGWAIIILSNGQQTTLSEGAANTTNNQMELTALYHALSYLPNTYDYRCTIYTDSAYIVNCIKQKWYEKWQLNGWKTSSKQPVANKELWEKILELWQIKQFTTRIEKVRGHSTSYYNNLADQIANKEAAKYENTI